MFYYYFLNTSPNNSIDYKKRKVKGFTRYTTKEI